MPRLALAALRRTRDAQGFSPLNKINKTNVGKLRMAWSLSLPPGPNQNTPLVHDGVMFVHAFKDILQAVDAVNGDILWQYTYRLPKDVTPTPKKSIALYDTMVFVPTSDAKIVALDVKTGKEMWSAGAGPTGFTMSGGPIVAKGKVIFGTRGPKPVIVALDAKTGKEAWRFNPIPKPGEPNYDTWNNMPYEARTGGTIWTPGSYDKETNLVFFGPAPTYDTRPLRDLVPGANNDALHIHAGKVDAVRIEAADRNNFFDFDNADLAAGGGGLIEVARSLAKNEVARRIGFPCLHDGEIGEDAAFEDIILTVEGLHVLAFGNLRSDACLGIEAGDAGAACTHAFCQGSLRTEFDLKLTSEKLPLELLVLANIGRNHLADLARPQKLAQTFAVNTGIV